MFACRNEAHAASGRARGGNARCSSPKRCRSWSRRRTLWTPAGAGARRRRGMWSAMLRWRRSRFFSLGW